MRYYLSLLVALASFGPCAAQSSLVDFAKLRYRDLPFSATKARIAQQLGPPAKTTEPHYECGGLSSQEQHRRFYALHYGPATYTGNARDSYVLEQVRFAADVALYYGAYKLTAAATPQQVQRLFKTTTPLSKQPDGTTLLFISGKYDEGVVFTFKNGHLLKYEYWTPC